MDLAMEQKTWAMSMIVKQWVDEESGPFRAMIPCMLAYWVRVSGISVDELRAEIVEQLEDQESRR